jgi:ferredoxin
MAAFAKRSGAIALCIAVSACAAQTELFWVRTDGKPVLASQFEMDRTLCNGEVDKSAQPGEAFRTCMAQKGYRQQAVE